MSERRRATHFALMDTAFAADRKFVRLAARAVAPVEYAAAVGVYWLLLADARRSRSSEVDWSEYEEYQPQIDLLRSVGLLDDHGFPPPSFDRWAPAYKSPWDTQRNATLRKSTQSNATSIQFNSDRGEGGVGEAGVWDNRNTHDGRHGTRCAVCAPLLVIDGGKTA